MKGVITMDNEYNYYTGYQETAAGGSTDPSQEQKPKKKRERKPIHIGMKWVTCICMAIVFGVLASTAFQASNILFNGILGIPTETAANSKKVSTTQVSTNSKSTVNSDVADIAENVMPSVVSITNLSVQQVQDFFLEVCLRENSRAVVRELLSDRTIQNCLL